MAHTTGGDSILLTSDDQDERELYAAGLGLHGFRVDTIDGVEEIPTAVHQLHPNALVVSLETLDPHTWATLEALQCGAALDVPGVFLTAWVRPDAEHRIHAIEIGCAAFVAKPCRSDELAIILRDVLSGTRGLVVMRPAEFSAGQGSDWIREPST